MGFQGGICTLCLLEHENCEAIEEHTKNILYILLPKIDMTIISEPVICRNCTEMLIKCSDFKTKCLHAHNSIVPFIKKNVNADFGVPEEQDICRFCMGLAKNVSAVSLGIEEKHVMLDKMVKLCLPELDFSTMKPVICAPCHDSLESCFRFISYCLIVEEKIKKYSETLDIDSKDEIDLISVLKFTTIDVKGGIRDNSVVDRKSSDQTEVNDRGDIIKLEEMFSDDCEQANEDDKIKNESSSDVAGQKVNNEQLTLKEEMNKFDFIKVEGLSCEENSTKHKMQNPFEMENRKCLLNEEIEIKTDDHDFQGFEDGTVLPQPEVTTRLGINQNCLASDVEGDKMKDCFKNHLLNHQKVKLYKCDFCSYQVNLKGSLNKHMLRHKDPSQVTMYRCDICLYQTKYKFNLKLHSLTHKVSSGVTLYKCDFCSYQTEFKTSLKVHLLKHKNSSEVTMYQCDSCLYQTKYERSIKRHLLKHKDVSEVTMYKCDVCPYQTKHKDTLKKHVLNHKDPSEITMYKCDSCSFQTKYRDSLTRHLLTHKDPSEVTMFKCNSCLYQTKHKNYLNAHLRTHRDPSKVKMYKCDSCSFQTKHKESLTRHLLMHKDPSEVTMYKCDSCLYQTRYKRDLRLHLQKHKDPSEVTMYKCDYCLYQTRFKCNIKMHLQKHKGPLEVDNVQM